MGDEPTPFHGAEGVTCFQQVLGSLSPSMRLAPECDLFVVTGERSGDAYGAAILRDLLAREPGLVCAAMAGAEMRQAGAEIEQDIDGLDVMGFWPVIKRLPFFVNLGRRMRQRIWERKPRLVVTIDYPGFNLRLLRQLQDLRQAGTRLVHVVAPQVWAWRARRAKVVAGLVDELLCFFPFEPRLFQRHGGVATFVGHPLADMVAGQSELGQVEQELGLGPDDRLLLLAPGSRRSEISDILPIFNKAWRLARPQLQAPGGKVVAVVSKTPDRPRELYRLGTDLPLLEGRYQAGLSRAHLGVITSGTATLEAGIIGVPHIIGYRSDAVSATIGRHIVRTRHMGLPNIVHDQRICPEMFQDELLPDRLARRIVACWQPKRHEEMRQVLATTRDKLGGGGALRRVAERIQAQLARGERRGTVVD